MSPLSSRLAARLLFCLLTVLAISGCRYDPDDRCGPNQQLDGAGVCDCAPGFVLDAKRGLCSPCPTNEEAKAGRCECKAGFERMGTVCAPVSSGQGDVCNAAKPCQTAAFPHCRTASGAADGYCTASGCKGAADCPAEWSCDTAATPPSCKRPPTGQGKPCSGSAECMGFEANYCEPVVAKACLVENCRVDDPMACHEGWRCCDVTKLGLPKTLCLKVAECP